MTLSNDSFVMGRDEVAQSYGGFRFRAFSSIWSCAFSARRVSRSACTCSMLSPSLLWGMNGVVKCLVLGGRDEEGTLAEAEAMIIYNITQLC